MTNRWALIVIDVQNDFVEGGALAISGGLKVISYINELLAKRSAMDGTIHFEQVVATQDWHPQDHRSFAMMHPHLKTGELFELEGLPQVAWPTHCVQKTHGARFVEQLQIEHFDYVVQKGTNATIDSYSGYFDNGHRQATELDDYLKSQNITAVYLVGLATDYCVKFTALDAVTLDYRTVVDLRGCRGVDLHFGDIERAIGEMISAGVEVIRA